jgi:4-hydroxy-3-polyprenylbenzoate decarboxylase
VAQRNRRIVVGISGASGSAYGYMALQALRAAGGVEAHLIVTESARRTIGLETDLAVEDFEALADVVYRNDDLAAAISSGSFLTDGMIVIPCSMKSASAIAHSMNGNLLVRAADVCLKEKRRVVLVVRETPLHLGHLRTLALLAEIGATILPPIPAMYAAPQTIDDVIAHTVGKALDQFGIPNELFKRWRSPE